MPRMGRMLQSAAIFVWSTPLVAACVSGGTYLSGDAESDTISIDDPASDPDGLDVDSTDAPVETIHADTPLEEIPDLSGWDPYADHLGDPGWRDSPEPLCDEPDPDWLWYYTTGYDVWSDSRGIFAFIGSEFSYGTDEMVFRIYINDGAGWSIHSELDRDDLGAGFSLPGNVRLAGVPGGMLMLHPDGGDVAIIDGGTVTMTRVDAKSLFVVDSSLIYATISYEPWLEQWDGTGWATFGGDPVPSSVSCVWADRESIFAAGRYGTMLSSEDDEEWVVHDIGTTASFSAIWGSSRDDVWAGTTSGALVHFDGESWQAMEWPDQGNDIDSCHRRGLQIRGIWGSEGFVFAHTINQFFMWDGASFTVLGYWPGVDSPPECTGRIYINDLWGNSPTEVFLAVHDSAREEGECGRDEYLLWWDGLAFHRL